MIQERTNGTKDIIFEILPHLENLFLQRATFSMKHLRIPPTFNILSSLQFFEQKHKPHLRNGDRGVVPGYGSKQKELGDGRVVLFLRDNWSHRVKPSNNDEIHRILFVSNWIDILIFKIALWRYNLHTIQFTHTIHLDI